MHVKLVIVGGRADKPHLNIELPTLLGRSHQADVTIAHSLVSRRHCELREHQGAVLLTDLGSLNGTYCGTRRVQRTQLPPKGRFTVGPLTFEIHYGVDEHATPGPHLGKAPPGTEPPIELSDPIEPDLVELDDPLGSGPIPLDSPTRQSGKEEAEKEEE